VETLRQKSTAALHTLITGSKIDLGEGKGVTQVKTTVHVRISHTRHVLGISGVEISRVGMLLKSGCIDFKGLCILPKGACFTFKCTKSVTLCCLI
jgi:hypothetical protein